MAYSESAILPMPNFSNLDHLSLRRSIDEKWKSVRSVDSQLSKLVPINSLGH